MVYKIEHTDRSGIILWLQAPCGFERPLLRWTNLEGVKRLADTLLNFYSRSMEEKRTQDSEMEAIAERLLEQALGDKDDI